MQPPWLPMAVGSHVTVTLSRVLPTRPGDRSVAQMKPWDVTGEGLMKGLRATGCTAWQTTKGRTERILQKVVVAVCVCVCVCVTSASANMQAPGGATSGWSESGAFAARVATPAPGPGRKWAESHDFNTFLNFIVFYFWKILARMVISILFAE